VSIAFKDPAEVGKKFRLCREQGIIVNKRAGRLRVSPHCYNSIDEIDRLVEMLSTDH
jgi:cysteine desulfurase / selenocysteine lyase